MDAFTKLIVATSAGQSQLVVEVLKSNKFAYGIIKKSFQIAVSQNHTDCIANLFTLAVKRNPNYCNHWLDTCIKNCNR